MINNKNMNLVYKYNIIVTDIRATQTIGYCIIYIKIDLQPNMRLRIKI